MLQQQEQRREDRVLIKRDPSPMSSSRRISVPQLDPNTFGSPQNVII